MNIYSPNMLKVFEKCPYEFYLRYEQKLSLPQKSFLFEKGKKIHALANYFFKGFDVSKMEKTLSKEEKVAWESLKQNQYFRLEPIEAEYNLSCKVSDFWVGGRLDALVRNGQKFYILDYKTGQIPKNAKSDFQTIIYLLCADKLLSKKGKYDSLSFVYLGLKNSSEEVVEFSSALKKQYEEKITETCKEVISSIKTNSFAKNRQNCANCEYNKLCNS